MFTFISLPYSPAFEIRIRIQPVQNSFSVRCSSLSPHSSYPFYRYIFCFKCFPILKGVLLKSTNRILESSTSLKLLHKQTHTHIFVCLCSIKGSLTLTIRSPVSGWILVAGWWWGSFFLKMKIFVIRYCSRTFMYAFKSIENENENENERRLYIWT